MWQSIAAVGPTGTVLNDTIKHKPGDAPWCPVICLVLAYIIHRVLAEWENHIDKEEDLESQDIPEDIHRPTIQ